MSSLNIFKNVDKKLVFEKISSVSVLLYKDRRRDTDKCKQRGQARCAFALHSGGPGFESQVRCGFFS
jgi:hypothetical protein